MASLGPEIQSSPLDLKVNVKIFEGQFTARNTWFVKGNTQPSDLRLSTAKEEVLNISFSLLFFIFLTSILTNSTCPQVAG